ncbi:acyl-CoA carboxylase epsilon subunit [Kocuria sp.]|uniref:acyl-CoA carboxylase epsilon subunit n=1 Tax=Kocuria sp. TaxID=1871328 RepID=UPI0026E0BECC|nr:acyl-CoA carboxylase epsilon subunit [Kocuria sp.]MDO5619117.1 acyl-CoA carboxylase epsilon subunit [Kocuria sp.]
MSTASHSTSAHGTPDLPEELQDENCVVQFVGGNPTPEEIAAVTAVVVAAAAETEEAETTGTRRAQNRRARLGLRLRPGLGAWRRTLPFR